MKDGEAKDGEAKDGETKALPRQPENSSWHGACGRNFEKSQFSFDVKGLALDLAV